MRCVHHPHLDDAVPKGQNFVVLLLLLFHHTLFPRDFSGTTADTDIVNTLLEPLRPTHVPFGSYKTETKDLRGFFCHKNTLVG